MNIRKYFLTALIMLCTCVVVNAQTIKGIVRDADTKEPLVGASVYWDGTTVGTSVALNGEYSLHKVKGYDKLVASFIGYVADTIYMAASPDRTDFLLKPEGIEVEGVVVTASQKGNYVKRDGVVKSEMISFAGLCKMACCNLAESFENSASVTVGYSDAISGARQIQMLGLAGTYTQILDENRPIMRGLGSPYGLSYTPGMWLNSIQVSKGVSSVTAGHEAITGQINLEHRKPTDDERFFLNLYLNDELRPEANISTALPVTKDKKLSTVIMLHGSADTDVRKIDHNKDGFRDMPKTWQMNVANKWLYTADNGLQLRWGGKYTQEDRMGGMWGYKNTESMRQKMESDWSDPGTLYGSNIDNRAANAYVKLGMPVGAGVYNKADSAELRSNFAVVADFDYYNSDAYFGLNNYNGKEKTFSLNAMYNHYFSYRSSLIAGVSGHMQNYNENLRNSTPWISADIRRYNLDRKENEVGAYLEYTYNIKDKFSLVAGIRGDYNSYFDRFFVTPRGHIKWNITPSTILRASAGMGYRTTNVITDNIGILATGREILFREGFSKDFDRMEKAATFGASFSQSFGLVSRNDATISVDYFRTQFFNQVIADQEYMPNQILIYNNDGPSFTDTYQIDFSWSPVERLDIFATFRYTNAKITIDENNGSGVIEKTVERPLVSQYKTLLNIQYATKFRRWVFDVTAQLNGPTRVPMFNDAGVAVFDNYSPRYPIFFVQVSRKVGKFDLYAGCENIGNYTQKSPILNADRPFSTDFNSMNVWGPLMGRKFYIGLRLNIF